MTTYRVVELPSLATELDLALPARDRGAGWNFPESPEVIARQLSQELRPDGRRRRRASWRRP